MRIWRQCAGCVGVPYRNMRGGEESVRRCRSRWGVIGPPEARVIRQPRQARLADRRTRAGWACREWNRAIALLPDVGRRRSRGPRGGRGGSPALGASYLQCQVERRPGRIARAWLPGKRPVASPFVVSIVLPVDALGKAEQDGAGAPERPPAWSMVVRGAAPGRGERDLLSGRI